MRAAISGLGLWLPPQKRTNSEWSDSFSAPSPQVAPKTEEDRLLVDFDGSEGTIPGELTRQYLASERDDPFLSCTVRHVAERSLTAVECETQAAKSALLDAGLEGSELDAVLSYSGVPDQVTPPTAPRIAHEVGAKNALAFGMEAACAVGLHQLQIARALIESGQARHVLITQSHLLTRTFPLAHPASPGIGDAGTAAVVSASEKPGFLGFKSVSHGEYYDAVLFRRDDDSHLFDAGGPVCLGSHNPAGTKYLMQHTLRYGMETVAEALRIAKLSASELGAIATVQPRAWVPKGIARSLGVDENLAPSTFHKYAHLGTSGVFANLVEAKEQGLLQPGAAVALYAQGAGFTRTAMILRWKPDQV